MRFMYILALLTVTGCATTPVQVGSSVRVPIDRVFAFQKEGSVHSGTIVVTRDKGFVGGACYYGIFINDIFAARLDVAETATFHVASGDIVLRSGRDPQGKGLCGLLTDEWTQRETTLKDNETKYFRLSIDANGKTDIQRTISPNHP